MEILGIYPSPCNLALTVNVSPSSPGRHLAVREDHGPDLSFLPVPWDVADQFDLIIPAATADFDQVMLFMRGHLMFFRHDKRVTNEFFNFPALRSLQSFLDTPNHWIDVAAGEQTSRPHSYSSIQNGYPRTISHILLPLLEEADYSHFAILNGNLTFMRKFYVHGQAAIRAS